MLIGGKEYRSLPIGEPAMSCYFRHMKDVFEEAGVEVTKDNKRAIDAAVHKAVGVPYKDCPSAWRAVKQLLAKGNATFFL